MCCDCKSTIYKWLVIITIIFIIFGIISIVIINNQKETNILTAIAESGDNTQVGNAIIKFSKNDIQQGNAITHTEGTDVININEEGIYQISYQLYGVSEVIGTFNFNAILLVNNTPLQDTLNESPVLTDNYPNRMTLTSTVILKLNSGDILQLGGLSLEEITYQRARIDIEKID